MKPIKAKEMMVIARMMMALEKAAEDIVEGQPEARAECNVISINDTHIVIRSICESLLIDKSTTISIERDLIFQPNSSPFTEIQG